MICPRHQSLLQPYVVAGDPMPRSMFRARGISCRTVRSPPRRCSPPCALLITNIAGAPGALFRFDGVNSFTELSFIGSDWTMAQSAATYVSRFAGPKCGGGGSEVPI